MSKSESRKKTELVQVRCTPAEKAMLRDRANAFGISVGELCRNIVFGTKPKSVFDAKAISELARLRADHGRLGGLLKGWLSGSFDNSPKPNREEIKSLLDNIKSIEAEIIAVVRKVGP